MRLGDCLTNVHETIADYSRLPIPSDVDRKISECLLDCASLDAHSTAAVGRTLSGRAVALLRVFSERMATHSLRTRDQAAFEIGLLSLRLASEREDWRDVLVVMSLYVDEVTRIGLALDSSLSRGGGFAGRLRSFMLRRPEDKRIEAMGYVLDNDNPDGVAYKRTGRASDLPIPFPQSN